MATEPDLAAMNEHAKWNEKHSLPANTLGAIDFDTGRVCVRVADFASSDLNGDRVAYFYSADADSFGMDPWHIVDGVDPYVDGSAFDLWFESGSCKTVGVDAVIYVDAADALRLAVAS